MSAVLRDDGDIPSSSSPLPGRTAWALAAIVFGTCLALTVSQPLAVWGSPDRWPQAHLLSRAEFLAVLAVGFAVQCAGIVVARWHPRTGIAVALGSYAVLVFALNAPGWVNAGSLPAAVIIFLAAYQGPLARTLPVLAATLAAVVAIHMAWASRVPGMPGHLVAAFVLQQSLDFVPLVVAGWVTGTLMGRQARRAAEARARADSATREQAERVTAAKEAERARIAQEMHDVTAQHLAGLRSLTEAAIDLAPEDSAAALGLLAEMRDESRLMAASLYGALGELRSTAPRVDPTPGAEQIAQLVDRWRARGAPVELFQLGDLTELPYVVSATAYRVVQEALANAAKYAPEAAVSVRLVADAGGLSITVENEAPTVRRPPGPGATGLGWGLSGLRERLTLLDATLSAGPTPAGRWRVHTRVPLARSGESGRAPQ